MYSFRGFLKISKKGIWLLKKEVCSRTYVWCCQQMSETKAFENPKRLLTDKALTILINSVKK